MGQLPRALAPGRVALHLRRTQGEMQLMWGNWQIGRDREYLQPDQHAVIFLTMVLDRVRALLVRGQPRDPGGAL